MNCWVDTAWIIIASTLIKSLNG